MTGAGWLFLAILLVLIAPVYRRWRRRQELRAIERKMKAYQNNGKTEDPPRWRNPYGW